jgi:hypothetical protein
MKKRIFLVLAILCLAAGLSATNTITSSKAFMVDQTGGWWRAQTLHYARQILTVDYTKGNGTSITITAGCRFTTEPLLIGTVTYKVPVISSTGAATSDPITITLPAGETSGSFVFTFGVPQTADYFYVLVECTDGTTTTVDINCAPDSAQPGR